MTDVAPIDPHTVLQRALRTASAADGVLEALYAWFDQTGLTPYDHQESAILDVLAGDHVILNTPTGSGKSLVALAAHAEAVALGKRSYYTAPIKALVSEKFFDLCRILGPEHVGLVTGDGAVNADAPVVCCTAEILANLALRDGAGAAVDQVTMDEFHFYGDAARGWAWSVPLIELVEARFLLMSATLGDTAQIDADLRRRTGRQVSTIRGMHRPVPLEFTYRETPILESLQELIDRNLTPAYLVHFTQRSAVEQASAIRSLNVTDKATKKAIAAELAGVRFDTPFGKELRRYLLHGVGVHHAGLLPRYRRTVERLAQRGLLSIICGTDTLGVGINVPIRTVLFSQLCKFDGRGTSILTVRDFQQIAGRAGRRGYDDIGYVWAQDPAHLIENRRMVEKAAGDPKKARKLVKRKAPTRGYVPWDADTFQRLQRDRPETLEQHFAITSSMLIWLLDRPGDGWAATRHLIGEATPDEAHATVELGRAEEIYASLLGADVFETLDRPDDYGRTVRINLDLQAEFQLNQPLAPFAVEVVAAMDPNAADYALDLCSVIESVLESPAEILRRQLDKLKGEMVAEMKRDGVDYETRMERLDELEHPKPLADFLYDSFNVWVEHHPWADGETVRPKSIVRDMFERGLDLRGYVQSYGLSRSEGLVLRYCSDAYRAFAQTVPETAKTDDVYDLMEWLGFMIRGVDSSLLDEWRQLQDGDIDGAEAEQHSLTDARPDITKQIRAFTVMVRNEAFRWVRAFAASDVETLTDLPTLEGRWSVDTLRSIIGDIRAEHGGIETGPDARGPALFEFSTDETPWRVRQLLDDSSGDRNWALIGHVDRERSREEGRAVVTFDGIERDALIVTPY